MNFCEEEVRDIYFTEKDKVDYEIIIDSGCPKTLAGEKQILNYAKRHNLDINQLKRTPCATIFKFGDSKYPSHEIIDLPVKLPVKNFGERIEDSFFDVIDTYVVKGDVPYLLGDNTMKKWQSKIDISNRTLELHKFKSDRGPILLNAPLKGSHMKIELQNLGEKGLDESVKLIEENVHLGEILTDFKILKL